MDRSRLARRTGSLGPWLLVLVLVAAACAGSSSSSKNGRGGNGAKSTSIGDAGKTPKRGGTLTYAVAGETNGGFCLPEAQLASGITVASAIYDTLTGPDSEGKAVPYLAKSVDHNADYTQWTIRLRPGIKFHDGSPLDATVVKNNLDAYRGKYRGRSPLLFLYVFSDVKDVSVVDPLTVLVTTKVPWVAFPSYLFSDGRLGMMAQAQLDDKKTCDRNLIGTGPFKLQEWAVNDHLTVVRNPSYWQKAPDNKPYPYLDRIVFRPVLDEGQRINSLQAGNVDVITTALGASLKTLQGLQARGEVEVNALDRANLVGHIMFNASKPPFDDVSMRQALAYGLDRTQLNDIVNDGQFDIADGPFARGGIGYLKDPGFPKHNVTKAKQLIADYTRRTGKPPEFVMNTPSDPSDMNVAELIQQQAKNLGMTVRLRGSDQAGLINIVIGGDYQATLFTNSFAAGDPDEQQVWWYGRGNPVNFGRINDPTMDSLLDRGRSEPDPAKRRTIYEDLNREFAKQVWNLWLSDTKETVSTTTKVHGILPPRMPEGQKPYYLRVTGDPPLAVWKE